MFHGYGNTFVMYRARYTFYNVLLNSITLMEYLTSHLTTFRKTNYRKIKLLEYIVKQVDLLEYIARPDLTFNMSHGVRAPLIDSLFQTSLYYCHGEDKSL
jgi:hypothetical protein